MVLLKETKELCQLYHIKPARARGQNFLVKEEIYDKMIAAADLNKDDVVLEIGPGLGFLTAELAKRVKKVIAVEIDKRLAEILEARLMAQGVKNVEVVNMDILKFSIFNFQFSNNFKVVANLPYNITSIFLRKFLSMEHKPEMMALMLQKEVAERIVAKPPKMSLLAVSVQFYAEPEIIEIVPANNFWPKPKVDSAIIKLKVHSRREVDEKNFFRLVKIGFSAKRKMLKNNLAAGYHISQDEAEEKIKQAGFNPKIRAQELSVEEWTKLFDYFK
ncbi:16S rRNA (adenine(1518)-N(6)/adenine(1519)-N(6))-dimethyltransferase RsmA [Candidatus Parcubacteria bacterium]|nr:16S rRNA (adenine(1518)-N(6)/adenine(1519)-N(6))-dimethyltransferase RsmA [Candidatus Parcubacteria bacterium]